MKILFMLIIILGFLTILYAEEADSVKVTVVEQEESTAMKTDAGANEDVFLDSDGDGIADDRTFRERMQNWRRTRSMSEKIRSAGQENPSENGKYGNKAKQGGQGNGNGNNPGNGNG